MFIDRTISNIGACHNVTLRHRQQQLLRTRVSARLARRVAALVAFCLVATATATVADAAYQSAPGIAITIAGPSVTYVVEGCPDPGVSDDFGSYQISFVTTAPSGSTITRAGVRTGDGQFSLTTDIRADDPDGEYRAVAACIASDNTIVLNYVETSYWVSGGTPSIARPVDFDQTDGADDATATDVDSAGASDQDDNIESSQSPADGTENSDDATANASPDASPTASADSPTAGSDANEPSTDDLDDGSNDSLANDAATPADQTTATDTGSNQSETGSDNAEPTSSSSQQDPTQTPSPTSLPTSNATSVHVHPTTVSSGDTVTTWVQGCPASVGGTTSAVAFSISSPSGSEKVATSSEPGADGSFSVAIRVPEHPETGTYTISASCGLQDGDKFVERRGYSKSSFEVVAGVGLSLPTPTPIPANSTAQDRNSSDSPNPQPRVQKPEIGFTG